MAVPASRGIPVPLGAREAMGERWISGRWRHLPGGRRCLSLGSERHRECRTGGIGGSGAFGGPGGVGADALDGLDGGSGVGPLAWAVSAARAERARMAGTAAREAEEETP